MISCDIVMVDMCKYTEYLIKWIGIVGILCGKLRINLFVWIRYLLFICLIN